LDIIELGGFKGKYFAVVMVSPRFHALTARLAGPCSRGSAPRFAGIGDRRSLDAGESSSLLQTGVRIVSGGVNEPLGLAMARVSRRRH